MVGIKAEVIGREAGRLRVLEHRDGPELHAVPQLGDLKMGVVADLQQPRVLLDEGLEIGVALNGQLAFEKQVPVEAVAVRAGLEIGEGEGAEPPCRKADRKLDDVTPRTQRHHRAAARKRAQDQPVVAAAEVDGQHCLLPRRGVDSDIDEVVARTGVDRHCVGGGREAGGDTDDVVTVTAVQRVRTAKDFGDDVIAVTAIDRVVAERAGQHVIANCARRNLVGRGRAGRVVAVEIGRGQARCGDALQPHQREMLGARRAAVIIEADQRVRPVLLQEQVTGGEGIGDPVPPLRDEQGQGKIENVPRIAHGEIGDGD